LATSTHSDLLGCLSSTSNFGSTVSSRLWKISSHFRNFRCIAREVEPIRLDLNRISFGLIFHRNFQSFSLRSNKVVISYRKI
jgi:hypothetical protein